MFWVLVFAVSAGVLGGAVLLSSGEEERGVSCPVDESVCRRANALFDALVAHRDYGWVVQNYPPTTSVLCNDPASGPIPPGVCDGAGASESRPVYTVFNRTVNSQEYTALLKDWFEGPIATERDDFGPPQPLMYSIGCRRAPDQLPCHDGFLVIFSKLMEAGEKASVRALLFFEFNGAQNPDLVTTFRGPFPSVAVVDSILEGGDLTAFFGAQRTTTFFPWRR